MQLNFRRVRKDEKEPARLKKQAGVELTEAELKQVWGGDKAPGDSGHPGQHGQPGPEGNSGP